MYICIQRNQADFKYSQIACLHFLVYYSEVEMNRRQKSLVCMNAHHFSGQLLRFKVIFLTWLGGKMEMIIGSEREKREVQT